tara:strand:+ start:67 stop:243 length:177 start_codon:yes stop_codon:yes gene_type:complete
MNRHPRDKMKNALDHLEEACNLLHSCRNEDEISLYQYNKLNGDIWKIEQQIKMLLGVE